MSRFFVQEEEMELDNANQEINIEEDKIEETQKKINKKKLFLKMKRKKQKKWLMMKILIRFKKKN